jgi:hypothetical protein
MGECKDQEIARTGGANIAGRKHHRAERDWLQNSDSIQQPSHHHAAGGGRVDIRGLRFFERFHSARFT